MLLWTCSWVFIFAENCPSGEVTLMTKERLFLEGGGAVVVADDSGFEDCEPEKEEFKDSDGFLHIKGKRLEMMRKGAVLLMSCTSSNSKG